MVIIIASGTDSKHPRWGHHAPDRWNVAGEQYTEIMISGEGLRRSPRDVLATLLHEAAHALAHARGLKNTSRQGRYHNKHFKTCAEEVGLTVEHDDRTGWSATTITPATELAYAHQLQALAEAMTIWRHGETTAGPKARRNHNLIAAICPCGVPSAWPPPPWPRPPSPARPATRTSRPRTLLTLKRQAWPAAHSLTRSFGPRCAHLHPNTARGRSLACQQSGPCLPALTTRTRTPCNLAAPCLPARASPPSTGHEPGASTSSSTTPTDAATVTRHVERARMGR